ncbi:MAG: ring-cleaving dioxygenase [Opitutales bacterium]
MDHDSLQPAGIHHLTAITAMASENHAFYTQTLGMRLVKKTVNQDDVFAYHLFYADALGSPGSDLTFFHWPVGPEKRGTQCIARTGLRVTGEAGVRWWEERFREFNVRHGKPLERDGRWGLDFEDPEGQRFTLVDDQGSGGGVPWDKSPVPGHRQIRGLGPVMISVPELEKVDALFTGVLNMRKVRDYTFAETGSIMIVYEMGEGGPAAELHVAVEPNAEPASQGAGAVHHVAFRVPSFDDYKGWVERLNSLGIPSSGPVDRYYFRSLYFRDPNGILFELATDGPGFTMDEPLETLGETLALPPFLEPRRREIEAGLKPLE